MLSPPRRPLLIVAALALRAAALQVWQPASIKRDIYSVQIWANDQYVDRQKYLRMLDALHKPALGQIGLVSGVDFASMVKFDYTRAMGSKVFIVPTLEFDNFVNSAPEVNKTMHDYVESGHLMIVGLGDPDGMDHPVEFINTVFGLSLKGSVITPGEPLERQEITGFAWPFEKAPESLPYVDNVFGVEKGSLPENAYKVYGQGDSTGVFIIPYGSGLIVGIGLDYTQDNVAEQEPWRDVLRIAVDEGRFLDKIRLGMSVIRHQGSTFGKIEAHGNWSSDGREELSGNGLQCWGWRKTLNCDPSGPRDIRGDRNCSAIIPVGESGFCECEGYVQTAAAPCEHRLINCGNECAKIDRRYRSLYGDSYDPPGVHEMHRLIEDAYKEHTTNMMHKADVAVANVDNMVKAMKQARDDVYDKINKLKDPPMWKALDSAGREAESAGKTVSDMSSMANPFLPDSVWTFPKNHPQPPPPPYSRHMPINPVYQAWLKDNLAAVAATPLPGPPPGAPSGEMPL